MKNIIEIKNLDKSFREVHAVNDLKQYFRSGDYVNKAVDDVSFKIRNGRIYGLLGPNGAGKSTTISIMCGTLPKDGGEVIIDGKNVDTDMKEITKELGVVFQTSVLDAKLSVKDNLLSRASLYGIMGAEAKQRIKELASLLNFTDLLNRTLEKLSGGQRRRIDVARALLHRPRILILDEPTTGLDPEARKTLWQVITDLRKQENMTVFLTTHYMEEAADADYVVILDNGKIAAEGTPLQLKNEFTGDFITLYRANENDIKNLGLPYEIIKDACRVAVKNTEEARNLIMKYPSLFTDFEITKGKMDDVFLAVTGKKPEGGVL